MPSYPKRPAPASAAGSCGFGFAPSGTAFTFMPGRAICRPETTTWSPSARPLLMTQFAPTELDHVDALRHDRAVRTRHHHERTLVVPLHGELRNFEAAVERAGDEPHGDVHARHQQPVRVRNTAAEGHGARGRVHVEVREVEVPGGAGIRCRRHGSRAARLCCAQRRVTAPAACARMKRSKSEAGWSKNTYSGSICSTVVSNVASP